MLIKILLVFGKRPEAIKKAPVVKVDKSLTDVTVSTSRGLESAFAAECLDGILIYGDTAPAMAAFYAGIRVGHVEAGLRTYDLQAP